MIRSAICSKALNALFTNTLLQGKPTISVNWEDQRNINTFGKTNSDLQYTTALLNDYKVSALRTCCRQYSSIAGPKLSTCTHVRASTAPCALQRLGPLAAARRCEIHNLISQRSTVLQKQVEGLEEAQNELMLADDDDSARYLFGACFVHTANEDADERINTGKCSSTCRTILKQCLP